MDEFARPELATAVRINNRAHRAALRYSIVERSDRQGRLHSTIDRVPNNPVRPHILDRAQVQLPLIGAMLGDVGQPQLVRILRGELAVDEVVMDRRAGPFC